MKGTIIRPPSPAPINMNREVTDLLSALVDMNQKGELKKLAVIFVGTDGTVTTGNTANVSYLELLGLHTLAIENVNEKARVK